MSSKYEVTFDDSPTKEDLAVLRHGLKQHGAATVGDTWIKDLTFFLRDERGQVRGGVFGNCGSFGWMYVDTLWVDDELRGNGYGEKLMTLIEAEAVTRSCKYVYLSTFTFQAPAFYEKLGYYEFGRLDDFPPGQSRVFMRKDLEIHPS